MAIEKTMIDIGASLFAILLTTLLMDRLKLPFILGVLLAGILIGPHSPLINVKIDNFNFNSVLIDEKSFIEIFASVGAVLILFETGLEFSLSKLSRLGISALTAAVVKIGLVFMLSFQVFLFLGFPNITALFIGVILSMSSTPMVIRLLKDNNLINRGEVPLITAILILEDLYAVFALSVLGSIAKGQVTEVQIAFSILKTVALFLFVYVVLSEILKRFVKLVVQTEESLLLTAIALAVVSGYMAELLGLTASIGAFLAGSIIAGLPQGKRIEEIVKPFNVVFAAFFFFSIGMLVDLHSIETNVAIALILTLLVIIGKFTGSSISAYLSGFNGISSCFIGVAMLSLSEVSMLVALEGAKLQVIGLDILSISSSALFVSVLLSALLIKRDQELYFLIKGSMPSILLNLGRGVSDGISEIKREIESTPMGLGILVLAESKERASAVYNKIIDQGRLLILHTSLIIISLLFYFVLNKFPQPLPLISLIIFGIIVIYSLIQISLKSKSIIDEVVSIVLKEEGRTGLFFLIDLCIAIIFLILAFYISPILSSLVNNRLTIFGLILISLLISFFSLLDASKKARQMIA